MSMFSEEEKFSGNFALVCRPFLTHSSTLKRHPSQNKRKIIIFFSAASSVPSVCDVQGLIHRYTIIMGYCCVVMLDTNEAVAT